jgi:hypothetical protein
VNIASQQVRENKGRSPHLKIPPDQPCFLLQLVQILRPKPKEHTLKHPLVWFPFPPIGVYKRHEDGVGLGHPDDVGRSGGGEGGWVEYDGFVELSPGAGVVVGLVAANHLDRSRASKRSSPEPETEARGGGRKGLTDEG